MPATSPQQSDLECIERLRAGDTSALAALYDRHSAPLYSLALRVTGRAEDAQDVLQEAWVQVWRRAAAYDPARASVAGWLVTIVRSRAIDRLRSRESRQRAEQGAGEEIDVVTAGEDAPDPSLEASFRRAGEQAAAALATLSPHHRQVLELAYFGGLPQSRIAEQLGAPLGTVKSWTRQGLTRLRELMSPEDRP